MSDINVSNAEMEAQIETLQIKLAHQEDSLEKLNDALVAQQLKIQSLEKKLTLLVDLIKENQSGEESKTGNKISHEIPPHY